MLMMVGIEPAMAVTAASNRRSASRTATAGDEVACTQAVDTSKGDRRVVGQGDGVASACNCLRLECLRHLVLAITLQVDLVAPTGKPGDRLRPASLPIGEHEQ